MCWLLLVLLAISACDRGSRPEQVGTVAPDFTVRDGGRSLSLHDYRGQVVVLNFWATWCPPCVEEMPSLGRMQRQLGDKVTVLAISTDEDDAAYRQFLSDRHIDLITIRDGEGKSNQLYGTVRFPETYIIDRRGVIRRKLIGAVDWTKPEMERYLIEVGKR